MYNGHILCMRQNEKGFYTNFAKSFLLIETIMYCIIVSYPYHQIKCQKLEKSGEHAVPEPAPQRRSTAGWNKHAHKHLMSLFVKHWAAVTS